MNDFPLVTDGVAAMLSTHADRVCVEEYTGRLPPGGGFDVMLCGPFRRFDAAQRLQALRRETGAKVVVFNRGGAQQQVDDASSAGADGSISFLLSAEALVAALEAVVSLGVARYAPMTSPTYASTLVTRFSTDLLGEPEGLTAQEWEIVALIVNGKSNQEIAEATFLSINSVKTYIRSAYRTMGVTSRSQAVLWGIHHGLHHQRRS